MRTYEDKQALIAEATRRIQAGEQAGAVRRALQIPQTTWSRWSKVMGFRVGDLRPGDPHARTSLAPEPGPSAATRAPQLTGDDKGLRMRRDRKQIMDALDYSDGPRVLSAVRLLEAMGDTSGVNAVLRAKTKHDQRAAAIAKLEAAAGSAADLSAIDLSNGLAVLEAARGFELAGDIAAMDALLRAKQKHDWRAGVMLKLQTHDPDDETQGGRFAYPPADASPITSGPAGRALPRETIINEIACHMYWEQERRARPWQEIMAEMEAGTYVPVAEREGEPAAERDSAA